MSLILEALRKLEREKATPEQRGFVVLGSPGPGRGRATGLILLAVAVAIAVGALAAFAWQRLGTAPPRAEPLPDIAAVPVPRPETPRRSVTAEASDTGPAAAAEAVPDRAEVVVEAEPAPEPAPASTVPARGEGPRFRLQAITQRDGRPVAILNDRLVREGDAFDGVRVVRIGELEVELETSSGNLVVRF